MSGTCYAMSGTCYAMSGTDRRGCGGARALASGALGEAVWQEGEEEEEEEEEEGEVLVWLDGRDWFTNRSTLKDIVTAFNGGCRALLSPLLLSPLPKLHSLPLPPWAQRAALLENG
eukprot:965613-Rhodomonas_salina.2